jgi:3-phytase
LSDLGRGPDPPDGAREVEAAVETDPVPSGGDAADDPATWVNRRRPERSTVIGTDKRAGIAVYGLDGAELQYRAGGEINNVDLRDRVLAGSPPVAVAAVTIARPRLSISTGSIAGTAP